MEIELEEGMIIRLLSKQGRHKKNGIYIIKEVFGITALAVNVKTKESLVLYKYSNQVELLHRKGGFYV